MRTRGFDLKLTLAAWLLGHYCLFEFHGTGVIYSDSGDVFARENEKLALSYAIDKINREDYFLGNGIFFQPKIVKLPDLDSFRAFKYGKFY